MVCCGAKRSRKTKGETLAPWAARRSCEGLAYPDRNRTEPCALSAQS
jgi:hypothetical protein